MADLRVLHVTPYYAQAWAYGGVPRVVAAQVKGLAGRGVQVTVATTDACDRASRATGPAQGVDDAGVEVRVFPNLSNRLAHRWQLFLPRGLDAFLRRSLHRFDLAHLHACHNLPGAIAARRLSRAGVPYLVQPNGTAARIERRRTAKWLFDASVGRRTLPGAARVIAVTEAERRQLAALGVGSGAVEVIPNPVDLDELAAPLNRGAFRERHGLGRRTLITYLGQLSPRKRVDLAVRAVAALQDPEPVLVIAGGDMGSERALRRLAAELGLASRTCFVGVLSARQRLEALADSDVVVYPTESEVFGLVPVEAILCGTPVVVSDDCGCGEVVGGLDGGVVAASGDVEALAAGVRDILANPDGWRPRVARAAERARLRYSAEAVAERLEELYETVRRRAGKAGKEGPR